MVERSMISRRDMIAASIFSTLLGATACRAAPDDRASLFDYLPPGEQNRIAAGRSEFDCAPILQRALLETAAAGTSLWVPRGTYLLAPHHRLAHEDRTFVCTAAVRLATGMKLAGETGAVLRMMPGYSTDRRPRAMVMFGATEPISDIEMRNVVLDMNGRANPISPARGQRVFNRFPQAQIFISGPLGNGEPARADRVGLFDIEFRDANGVSCIVMGQTDKPGSRMGRGWKIDRCSFLENGLDTDDHSSVFAYADDVSTTDCIFSNARAFDGRGINTAYEVHGSNQTISGCRFVNAMRGIWVANNYSSLTRGTAIRGNAFYTLFYGVDFFHDRASARGIADTVITNNRFNFDDRVIDHLPRLDFKAAVQIASEFGQSGIAITGNRVTKTGAGVSSAFLVITGGASGPRRHDAITASGNSGEGLTFGSFVRTSPDAGLGRITIVRNHWTDLTPSPTMVIAAGDVIEQTGRPQTIDVLTLGGGTITDTRTLPRTTHSIFMNGAVGRLSLALVSTTGAPKATYAKGGAGSARILENRE